MPRPDFETTHRKRRYGRCRICQKFGLLTKEHVPPKKAFNNTAYLKHYIQEIEEAERIRWQAREERTNGIYVFSLCENCNSRTGRIYGGDYVKFVEAFFTDAIPDNANKIINIEIKDCFPLRVVKQTISNFLSTSEPTSFLNHTALSSRKSNRSSFKDIDFTLPEKSHLHNIYNELRTFVRKRDSTGLPHSVRLYSFAIANAGVSYRTGIQAKVNLVSKKPSLFAVTGAHPILWVLRLQGDIDENLLDITEWANFEYGQKKTIKVEIPCYWSVGKYPIDFRSPQELYEQHFVNSMIREGLIFTDDLDKPQELQEALYFARTLSSVTKEGYLIRKFGTGVFIEFGEINGWLRDGTVEDARHFIEWRLAQ